MKPRAISKTFLLMCFIACTTTRITTPPLEELQSKEVIKVSLQDLLKNKATYQGHFIETQGIYQTGFEESAIYYQITIPLDPFKRQQIALYDGLWIDIHPSYNVTSDSLKDKMIKVRGFFDTTSKGHLGGYAATLKNTYLMQSSQ